MNVHVPTSSWYPIRRSGDSCKDETVVGSHGFFKFDFDWCAHMGNKPSWSIHPFVLAVIRRMRQQLAAFFHECPYFGMYSLPNIDITEIIEGSVPRVVPVGSYKGVFRFFDKRTNGTYMSVWGTANVTKTLNVE